MNYKMLSSPCSISRLPLYLLYLAVYQADPEQDDLWVTCLGEVSHLRDLPLDLSFLKTLYCPHLQEKLLLSLDVSKFTKPFLFHDPICQRAKTVTFNNSHFLFNFLHLRVQIIILQSFIGLYSFLVLFYISVIISAPYSATQNPFFYKTSSMLKFLHTISYF